MRKVLNSKFKLLTGGLILLMSLNWSPVWGRNSFNGDIISSEQAAVIAKQGRDIKVLKVVPKTTPRGLVYKVKLLTKNGRVKRVRVNAQTGTILKK